MSKRYRIVVKHLPANDVYHYAGHVYDEEGHSLTAMLGETSEEAEQSARRWVAAENGRRDADREVWVDERGADAAGPEAHSVKAS